MKRIQKDVETSAWSAMDFFERKENTSSRIPFRYLVLGQAEAEAKDKMMEKLWVFLGQFYSRKRLGFAFAVACSLLLLCVPQVAAAKNKKASANPFRWGLSGYLLAGYRMTLNDEKLLRLGDSDGFYVSRARLQVKTQLYDFTGIISFDGSFDRRADPLDVSPATRRLFMELRDAFVMYQKRGFFVTAGQDKVPFGMHSTRSTTAEHFINFPLIAVGEDIAFGYQVRSIMPGRDIGLKLGYKNTHGLLRLHIEAMLFNGNGPNRFANDSDIPAVGARIFLGISQYFDIGLSFMWNQRRVGDPPNLFDESDLVFGADLAFRIKGFFLEGEFAARQTDFVTTGQASDFSFGFRGDTGYRYNFANGAGLEVAVRVEMFDPSGLFDDDMLLYITPAVNFFYKIWRNHEIAIRLNYTVKLEMADNRNLSNDQLNLLLQYRF